LGQFGSINIPVSAGGVFEFTFGLGGVDSSTPTPATATTVVYNSALVLTCNGASAGSGMNGGSGASLAEGAFNSYSCGGGVGWCQQREKIDWQEPRKFDCWLVRTIFYFLLSSGNFPKLLVSG